MLIKKNYCIYPCVALIWIFLNIIIISSSCGNGDDGKNAEDGSPSVDKDVDSGDNSDEDCEEQWACNKDCALDCNDEHEQCIGDCAMLEINEDEDCRILCHANQCRCWEFECGISGSCIYCY